MTIEDMSQEKSLIHQEHAYFIMLSSVYVKSQYFQEAWHHEDP